MVDKTRVLVANSLKIDCILRLDTKKSQTRASRLFRLSSMH